MSRELPSPELLARLRAREPEALRELVAAVEPRLFGLARRLTGDADQASDLVQETFLRALATLESFRGEAPIAGWMLRILLNRWRSGARRNAPEPLADEPLAPDARAAQQRADRGELAARLEREVQQLSPLQRATILLRSREGMSYAEIGTALGISLSSVKVHIHNARRRLSERLGAVAEIS